MPPVFLFRVIKIFLERPEPKIEKSLKKCIVQNVINLLAVVINRMDAAAIKKRNKKIHNTAAQMFSPLQISKQLKEQ